VATQLQYGADTLVSSFSPPDGAYQHSKGSSPGSISLSASPAFGHGISTTFAPFAAGGLGPFPLAFYQNVTNQPLFGQGNGTYCDNIVRFFGTSITKPVGIQGNVTIFAPWFNRTAATTFSGIPGLKLDTAFVENNFKPCAELKGFAYGGQ